MTDPSVVNAHTNSNGPGNAVFVFEDGRQMVFFPNHGSFGEAMCNEAVVIRDREGNWLATYNSPHQTTVNRQPFGFTDMTLDVGEFQAYFRSAYLHANIKGHGGQRDLWNIVSLSWADLEMLAGPAWCPLPPRW